MEQELITRYLEPVLSSLLDDPAEDAFFRWTATINEECRSANAIAIRKKRSDSCISYLDECSWEPMQGFGAIKCHGEADNKHAIGKDLLRLGIFAKNAIDTHNLDSILVFQAIRRRIFFYIVTLENAVMYVMFEIGEVEVPARLLGLACYIEQINVLLDMLYIYDQLCHTADNDRSVTLQQWKRKTVSTSEYNCMLVNSRNRKRPSVATH